MLANAKKFSKKKIIRLNFKKKNNSFFKPFAITSEVKPCTKVSIRITSNNVFLTIFNLEKKKLLFQISAGKINLRSSKRSVKDVSHKIFNRFLKVCRSTC